MQYCLRSFCPNVPTTLTSWPFFLEGGNKYLKKEQILKDQCLQIVGRRTVLCVCLLLRGSGCGQLSTRKRESVRHPVMSDSLQPYGLYPAGLLCPEDSPGKNTEVSCHSLLQGIFPTQASHIADSLPSEPPGKPWKRENFPKQRKLSTLRYCLKKNIDRSNSAFGRFHFGGF